MLKLEYIINKLERIKDIPDDEHALKEYNKLIDDLKHDLLVKNCKKTTKASKLSAIKADVKLKKELMYYNDKINFNNKMLLNMMDILPEGSKYYVYNNSMIIGISPDEEERGLVLGVRIY